jgi:hypothetical protein
MLAIAANVHRVLSIDDLRGYVQFPLRQVALYQNPEFSVNHFFIAICLSDIVKGHTRYVMLIGTGVPPFHIST